MRCTKKMFTAASNQTHPYVNAGMWDASSKEKLKSKMAWVYSQINTKNGYNVRFRFPFKHSLLVFLLLFGDFWQEASHLTHSPSPTNHKCVCKFCVRFVWDWPRCKDSDWQLLVAWRSSQIVDHIPQCALQLWI